MFDFQKELQAIREQEAQDAAAKKAKEDREMAIALDLANKARDFRDQYNRPFDVQIVKSRVEIVSMDGRALTVTIKPDDLFDVTGGAKDVNARGWLNMPDVTASEVTQTIIRWTSSL